MTSVSNIKQILYSSDITHYAECDLVKDVVKGLEEAPEEVISRIFSFILGVETYYAQPTNSDGAKMFTAAISPHNARMGFLFYRALPESKKPESHFIIFERMRNIIAADNLMNKELPPVIRDNSCIELGSPFNSSCKRKSLYSWRGINVVIKCSSQSISINDESMEGFKLPYSGSSLLHSYGKRVRDFATDFDKLFFLALDTHLEIYTLANRNTFVIGSPIRLAFNFWRIRYQGGVLHGQLEYLYPRNEVFKLNFVFPSSDPDLIPKEPASEKVINPEFFSMHTLL